MEYQRSVFIHLTANNMKIEDTNEEKVFHPSLDIKDGVVVLGFRIKKEKGEDVDIFIIKTSEGVTVTESLSFQDKEEHYSIDKKKRVLSKLSKKWGEESANKFIEGLQDGAGSTIEGFALYTKIKEHLKKYIELEREEDYIILTAWVIGTYFSPIFNAYPYIHIKAPKGSGKSQCLGFLNQIAFNTVKARASLPALRDTVDSLRGTYLIDQADSLNRNNMEEILDVLTDSYKKDGGSMRKMIQTKKGNWEVEEFEAYCPKVFASINQLPEDLRDRCIVIPLIRSNKNLPTLNEGDYMWKEIRGNLYEYLITEHSIISGNYLACIYGYKAGADMVGRKLELWLPIETVLMSVFVEKEEVEMAKKRFLARYEFAGYQTSEIEVAVIETIIKLMKDGLDIILHPKEIASEIDEDQFEEEDKFTFASIKQKSTIVGRAITKFNLASQKLSRDSGGERYLFTKEHLKKVHDGYFTQQVVESDTQTLISKSMPKNMDLLNVSFSES
jgi:hypothetical protein